MNKAKLLNRKNPLIGSWITIASTDIVEILSTANFDWLCIDLEHTSIDLEAAKQLIIAIQSKDILAFVRVSKNEEVIIKRVLDIGADGLIVPMINTKSDAEQAVNYSKYPPNGSRGVGLYRAQNYGLGLEKYKDSIEDLIIIAQIEHYTAVQNIDDILEVDGIDGTIIGPYDLSASMGMPGNYNNISVQTEIDKVKTACESKGKPFGFHVIEPDYKILLRRIEEGCTILAFSIDFFFLGDSARKNMAELRKKIQ